MHFTIVLLSKSHLEPSACKEDPFLKPPVPQATSCLLLYSWGCCLQLISTLLQSIISGCLSAAPPLRSVSLFPSPYFFLPFSPSQLLWFALPTPIFILFAPLLSFPSSSPLLFLLRVPLPWLPPIYLMSVSRYLFYYYYLGTISKNSNFSSFSKNHHQQKPSWRFITLLGSSLLPAGLLLHSLLSSIMKK